MKFLIVDDDLDILRMMTRRLTQRGHEVEVCAGPFGASVRALRQRPDVILLDVKMPGLDGPQLSEAIDKLPLQPPPRVALWSSGDERTLAGIARESGLPTYSKRQPINEVLEALESLAR